MMEARARESERAALRLERTVQHLDERRRGLDLGERILGVDGDVDLLHPRLMPAGHALGPKREALLVARMAIARGEADEATEA